MRPVDTMRSFDIKLTIDLSGAVAQPVDRWPDLPEGLRVTATLIATPSSAGNLTSAIVVATTIGHVNALVAPSVEAAISHKDMSGTQSRWPVIVDFDLAKGLIDSPYLRRVYLTTRVAIAPCVGNPMGSHRPDGLVEFVRKVQAGPCLWRDGETSVYDFTRDEAKYAQLLRKLIVAPTRDNRTGTPTRMLFSKSLRFELTDGRGPILPLITLKRTAVRAVMHELIWFLRGSTDTKYLQANSVPIWDGNTTREALDSRGLELYEPGECGPIYGFQWRNWGGTWRCANMVKKHGVSTATGIDQLAAVINSLKTDPLSRRHIVSAWNVDDLDDMALPPCHFAFQFVAVAAGLARQAPSDLELGGIMDDGSRDQTVGRPPAKTGNYELHCAISMRSADVALGVPFNIASYALLTHMVANIVGMTPGSIAITMTDCHVYSDHIDGVKTMLEREPRRAPTITLPPAATIDEYAAMSPDQFVIGDYHPHPAIKLNMAA